MDITRWSIQNQIDCIICSQRWRSSIQSAKTRPGAECGSDHELLNSRFRLKLNKVGKITRPFRRDLNQIPYDNTVEVTNRFKGLDLIDRQSAWRTMDRGLWHCTGGSNQTCNHQQNQNTEYFHHPNKCLYVLNPQLLPVDPGNHWSDFCFYSFPFSRLSFKWNEIVCLSSCLNVRFIHVLALIWSLSFYNC